VFERILVPVQISLGQVVRDLTQVPSCSPPVSDTSVLSIPIRSRLRDRIPPFTGGIRKGVLKEIRWPSAVLRFQTLSLLFFPAEHDRGRQFLFFFRDLRNLFEALNRLFDPGDQVVSIGNFTTDALGKLFLSPLLRQMLLMPVNRPCGSPKILCNPSQGLFLEQSCLNIKTLWVPTGYEEFLRRLAEESGIATPTREQLAKLDRKRAKKGSNDDWVNPHDPEAEITPMKDGRTHLAYKAEHAVDLETGAVVAVTVTGGAAGDTETILQTLPQAGEHIAEVACTTNNEEVGERVHPEGPIEAVTDKGYHSNDTLQALAEAEVRPYISEPDRGRRR
jgi:hypothetical protein